MNVRNLTYIGLFVFSLGAIAYSIHAADTAKIIPAPQQELPLLNAQLFDEVIQRIQEEFADEIDNEKVLIGA